MIPVLNRDRNYSVDIGKGMDTNINGSIIKVYTDGSKKDGHAGAGAKLTTAGYNKEKCLYLGTDCTVFQAEVKAIQVACEMIETNNKLSGKDVKNLSE